MTEREVEVNEEVNLLPWQIHLIHRINTLISIINRNSIRIYNFPSDREIFSKFLIYMYGTEDITPNIFDISNAQLGSFLRLFQIPHLRETEEQRLQISTPEVFGYGTWIRESICKVKEHPLDQKYPRVCYNPECFSDKEKKIRKKIQYKHALHNYLIGEKIDATNYKDILKFNDNEIKFFHKIRMETIQKQLRAKRQFNRIWRSEIIMNGVKLKLNIPFYCCTCLTDEKRKRERQEKMEREFKEREKIINEICERYIIISSLSEDDFNNNITTKKEYLEGIKQELFAFLGYRFSEYFLDLTEYTITIKGNDLKIEHKKTEARE